MYFAAIFNHFIGSNAIGECYIKLKKEQEKIVGNKEFFLTDNLSSHYSFLLERNNKGKKRKHMITGTTARLQEDRQEQKVTSSTFLLSSFTV